MTPTNRTKSSGLGCLLLFALPFAGIGTFMAYLLLSSLWSYAAIQRWQEVPVRILEVSLQESYGESTTYKVKARYEYRFEGRIYTGRRVGLHGGSDNIDEWQQKIYRELKEYRDSSRGFPGYVNPSDPRQAVLYRNLRWKRLGMYGLFALVFGGVGYGMVFFGIFSGRSQQREEELKERYPQQPWRHREDWAVGEVSSATRPTMIFSWVFAILWTLGSLPILYVMPREIVEKGHRLAAIGLIFPVIGIGLLIGAVRKSIRHRRFGNSMLKLDTLPAVIGGPLAGTIHIGSELRPEKGFFLELDGVNRHVTGRGRHRRTRERIFHQESVSVPVERTGWGMNGTTVPVRFAIPYEAPPTSRESSRSRNFWRLTVSADVPGVDYNAGFEVPVFRTPESSPDFAWTSTGENERFGQQEDLLGMRGLRLDREGGAFVIHLAAARNMGAAFGLTIFWAIWCGVIALMIKLGAPLLFPIVFGLFALLIGTGVLDLWCGATRIEVRFGELSRRGGLFALGRRRTWRAGEIERLEVAGGMQAGRKLFYRLQLVPQEGRTRTLAARLDSRAQAEALARRIEEVLDGKRS